MPTNNLMDKLPCVCTMAHDTAKQINRVRLCDNPGEPSERGVALEKRDRQCEGPTNPLRQSTKRARLESRWALAHGINRRMAV